MNNCDYITGICIIISIFSMFIAGAYYTAYRMVKKASLFLIKELEKDLEDGVIDKTEISRINMKLINLLKKLK